MRINLEIDPTLIEEAQKLGGLDSYQDTVELALTEFIQRRKQLQLIEVFGTIDYGKYDYKASRKDVK
jgi:Arc/MetJ family transcription regulator